MSALQKVTTALGGGSLVLLIDDLEADQSGYLVAAAASCDESQVVQICLHSRGTIHAAVSEERLRELSLHPRQRDGRELAFGVEARFGVSTGISAADRAQTLRTLAITERPRQELVIPGHIFPILAKDGGVLVRAAAAEAACDLLSRAGCVPVAALARCLDNSGAFMRKAELHELAKSVGLPHVTISELLCERLATESLVEQVTRTRLPLEGMEAYEAIPFISKVDGAEHLALIQGDIANSESAPLVRVQSERRIADLFGVGENDTRAVMESALRRIDAEGCGVFLYIRHPRRGAVARQARELQSKHPANRNRANELREYGIGTQILRALGVQRFRLLSSTTTAIAGIENFQIEMVAQEKL